MVTRPGNGVGTVRLRQAGVDDLETWDHQVRRFANHRVAHTRAWVESLAASGLGQPLYLLFEKQSQVVGCLPGLLVSLAGRRLFGSPLAGWQTVSMGPAFDPARLTTAELLGALLPYLEERHRVAYVELLHSDLDPQSMRAFGFAGRPVGTYRAPLFPGDEARTFAAMKDSARRNVRRAERLGLVVRLEDDEGFVAEHYDQLREVYLRGGHTIPFGEPRMRACFRHMREAGHLLATSVYPPGERVCIATGMFLVEGRELSLWSWAHRADYRWYRPTELMTWMAMRRAMAAGCETFDLMGRGDFKGKFGAQPDGTKWRWMRGRPRWLALARDLAEAGYRGQQALRGGTVRLVRQLVAPLRFERRGNHRKAPVPACVMGDLDLVRALGLGGVESVVVAPPGAPARFSRFTRAALPWTDPWDRPDQLVDTLVAHGAAQCQPPVLFYQEDRSLLMVSRHRARLAGAFRFTVPDATLVEELVDKGRFSALAARLGLPVPPARCFQPAQEPPPSPEDLRYPVILKPHTRRPETWDPLGRGRKAIRLDGPEALRALWDPLAAAGLAVMIQRFIPGPESRIESYHVYVDQAGEIAAEFTGRKIRTHPAQCGDSTALEITAAGDVTALGRDIVRRLNLRGVAKLDFKRGPDGRLYLLEINPRFTLWHHLGAAAGVNIPALVYGDLLGLHRPSRRRARVGTRWCRMWTDWQPARAAGVSLAHWLRWALACEARPACTWDDPLPLLGAALWRGLRAWPRRARTASLPAAPTLTHERQGESLTYV